MINKDRRDGIAAYLRARLSALGLHPDQIAEALGDRTLCEEVLAGRAQLPIDRVTDVARLVDTDPMELLSRCLADYHPRTFAAIEARLEDSLTRDELTLVKNLRAWAGSPYLAALTDEQQSKLTDWLKSLRPEASSRALH